MHLFFVVACLCSSFECPFKVYPTVSSGVEASLHSGKVESIIKYLPSCWIGEDFHKPEACEECPLHGTYLRRPSYRGDGARRRLGGFSAMIKYVTYVMSIGDVFAAHVVHRRTDSARFEHRADI
jgi:hypothetical protein